RSTPLRSGFRYRPSPVRGPPVHHAWRYRRIWRSRRKRAAWLPCASPRNERTNSRSPKEFSNARDDKPPSIQRDKIVEDAMRALLAAIMLTLVAAAAVPATTGLLAHNRARTTIPLHDLNWAKERPVENVSLGRPSWEDAAGLLVAELTLSNHNDYAVNNVI